MPVNIRSPAAARSWHRQPFLDGEGGMRLSGSSCPAMVNLEKIAFALMAHRQHCHHARVLDLVKRDITCLPKFNHHLT